MMNSSQDSRSVPQLLSDLTHELATLVRQEGQLVRVELSEKVGQVKAGMGEIGAGSVLMLAAVIFVLQAVVYGLGDVIGLGWASLVVGVAAGLIGFFLLKAGAKSASPQNLKPERALHQVGEDVRLAKEQVS